MDPPPPLFKVSYSCTFPQFLITPCTCFFQIYLLLVYNMTIKYVCLFILVRICTTVTSCIVIYYISVLILLFGSGIPHYRHASSILNLSKSGTKVVSSTASCNPSPPHHNQQRCYIVFFVYFLWHTKLKVTIISLFVVFMTTLATPWESPTAFSWAVCYETGRNPAL